MAIEIEFGDNFEAIGGLIDMNIATKAAKAALRRTAPTLNKESLRRLQREMKVKPKDWKQMTRLKRVLKGNKLARFVVFLDIKKVSLPLFSYIVGSGHPRKQRGIKVEDRKPLSFKYAKGGRRTSKDPTLFVAKGKGGKRMVFRRQKGTKSEGKRRKRTNKQIKVQPGPVAWVKFLDQAFRLPIEKVTARRLQKEFIQAYKFFMKPVVRGIKRGRKFKVRKRRR